MNRGRNGLPGRGQSLVEFALVLPLLLVLFGGAVQYGLAFAAKNTLIQIARDTGRWAATQTDSPCRAAATSTPPQPLTQADNVASDSSLIGYARGTWNATNFTSYPDNNPLPSAPPKGEGIEVVWTIRNGTCPPPNNTAEAYVTVRVTHAVPVLLPGLQFLPALGTCDASGCHISLTATSMFRMEPAPP